MKPVATRLLSVVRLLDVARDRRRSRRTSRPPRSRTIRASASRPASATPATRRSSMELVATMPRAEGFFDPKAPRAASRTPRGNRGGRRGDAGRPVAARPPAAAAAAPAPRRRRRPPARRCRAPRRRRGRAVRRRPRTSPTPTWRSAAPTCSSATSTASTPTTSRTPKKPRLLASVVCPGGQGDMSVHGNLLFMSVEQTRGRVDCGTQGVTDTASAERFRGVRIFDISDISKPKQVAAVQTCRGSHTHTLVTDPKDTANIYVYGSGTGPVRPGEELAGCSAQGAGRGSEHGALQHRRHQGAARGAREGGDRQPPAHLRRREDRRDRRPREGRRPRPRHAGGARDEPVPRHHGLSRGRPRGRRLLGQRHPARHLRSGAPGAPRRRRRTRTSPTGTRRRSTTTAPR